MTLKETAQIFAVMQLNYPDTFRNMSDQSLTATVRLWQRMFADTPAKIVQAAVENYIRTSTGRFMPNVGQIKAEIRRLTHPDELTEGEAWAMVQAAMRNSAYGAAEEFAKLPPLVRRVVGSPANLKAWGTLEDDSAQSVIMSNFQRGYRTIQARETKLEQTPPEIRAMFAALTKEIDAPEGPARLEQGQEDAT
ncbi:MAG: hypothetical protein J5633_10065 [Oscillospiraceae bacterium]|nr:hypothetical protein [Oscillospiraceae bacterium]